MWSDNIAVQRLNAARVPVLRAIRALQLPVACRHNATKRLHQDANYETRCGTVVKEACINYNGHPLTVLYIDIKALFLFLSEMCPLFGPFLHSLGLSLHAVIYMDKTTPGNQLRPDCGRSFEAVYWTLFEFPEHMRRRVANWFTFMYVQVKDLKATGCKVTEVMRFVVEKIWLESEIHTVGLHVFCNGALTRMTLAYGGWLADDLGIYELGSCNGPQSRKPCPCCLNVLGRCEHDSVDGDPYLVHVHTCFDATRFDATSAGAYAAMCDKIEELHNNADATKAEKDKTELMCGIKYQRHGIIFNPACRDIIRFPELLHWDPQHNLFSSSGVGQYVVNEVARQIVEQEFASLLELDEFSSTIKLPKDVPVLSRSFFQDRIKLAGGHLKGFANETITAVIVLGFYADEILTPAGGLTPFVELLNALRVIVNYVQLGDEVVVRMDAFETALADLHRRMVEVCIHCCKIKPHLMRHIADSLKKFRKSFNCFAPENKHRSGKAIAAHAYNGLTSCMLAHDVQDLREHFSNSDAYAPMCLVGACRLPELDRYFEAGVMGAKQIRTARGHLHIGDVVLFKEKDQIHAGRPTLFLKLGLVRGRAFFACVINQMRCVGPAVYSLEEGHPSFHAVDDIIMRVPYQKRAGNTAKVIVPSVFPAAPQM